MYTILKNDRTGVCENEEQKTIYIARKRFDSYYGNEWMRRIHRPENIME